MINVSPGIDLLRAAVALAYVLCFLRHAKLLALAAAAAGAALWASAWSATIVLGRGGPGVSVSSGRPEGGKDDRLTPVKESRLHVGTMKRDSPG
jgi:hypothetical protein